MLRITVARLNYTVGNIAGNVAKMIAAARQASAADADLVFSDPSLTGSYPGDLLDEPDFLAPAERAAATAFVARLRADPAGEALVRRVRGLIARNEYKRRQAPPIIRVRSRAFGGGRQMPIAAKVA